MGAHLLLLGGATGAPRPSRSPREGARDSPGCDPSPRPPCCRRGAGGAPRGAAGWPGTGQRLRGASRHGSEVCRQDRAPPHRRRAAGSRRRRRRAAAAPPGLLPAPAAAAGAASLGCLLRNLSPLLGPEPRLSGPPAGLPSPAVPRGAPSERVAALRPPAARPTQSRDSLTAREPCPTARPDVGLRCLALCIQPAGR